MLATSQVCHFTQYTRVYNVYNDVACNTYMISCEWGNTEKTLASETLRRDVPSCPAQSTQPRDWFQAPRQHCPQHWFPPFTLLSHWLVDTASLPKHCTLHQSHEAGLVWAARDIPGVVHRSPVVAVLSRCRPPPLTLSLTCSWPSVYATVVVTKQVVAPVFMGVFRGWLGGG